MAGKSKSWTPERRAAQSARMKERKIWLHSTGQKTPEGKESVRFNAWKHGLRSAEMAALSKLLTTQARFVKSIIKTPSPQPSPQGEGKQHKKPLSLGRVCPNKMRTGEGQITPPLSSPPPPLSSRAQSRDLFPPRDLRVLNNRKMTVSLNIKTKDVNISP